jgi:hypothetical protein
VDGVMKGPTQRKQSRQIKVYIDLIFVKMIRFHKKDGIADYVQTSFTFFGESSP